MTSDKASVDYSAVLADLEAKRDELDAAINAIRRIIGAAPSESASNGGGTPGADTIEVRKGTFFGLSAVDAAKKYLQMSQEPKGTKDIASAIQKGGFHTIAKNLYSNMYTALSRDDEIVKVGKGLWGLREWYKGRPLPKQGKSEKNGGAEKETDESA